MYWDEKREGFVYYSDATIPYRYLEVVARKYVIMNDCKEIYVDMREELKEAETRKQKRKEEQERKKEEEKKREEKKETVVKKSVFAKLKNPISLTKGKEKEKEKEKLKEDPLLIKERSNKYSCEGRIRNFSFLKKSKREVGNRMTFAEFKSGNFS
jgi:ABC-type multidrug transport system ATPase subunit